MSAKVKKQIMPARKVMEDYGDSVTMCDEIVDAIQSETLAS